MAETEHKIFTRARGEVLRRALQRLARHYRGIMNRFLGGCLAFCFGATPLWAERPERPLPAIERVLIICVDGLRPDRLLLADTPVIRSLMADGSYTMWARTTAMATTLPAHVSMMTGVVPRKHRIYWNDPLPLETPIYPSRPTIFEMARRTGYSTAMVMGKAKFLYLNKPGTIQQVDYPAPQEPIMADGEVAARAGKIIIENKPEVMLVGFPEVDEVGHAKGWGSLEQLEAINRVDGHVGTLLAALASAGLRDSTLIILTSDHGGAGLTHSMDDERSRIIPWIVVGPGIKRGFDLTQVADLRVNIEDTCATACHVLGLSQLPYFDGKPVLLAFDAPTAP